jgi:UPF0755 protein
MRSARRQAGAWIFRFFLLFAVVLMVGAAALYISLMRPYQGFSDPVMIEFPKGTSSSALATKLADEGVLRFRWQFLLARALRPNARLLAGEYQFRGPASVWTVFDRIARGDVFFYELTVPEGSNIFDIAQNLEELGIVKAADFLREARNPSLIRDLAPKAPTLEGYLFPSTYRLTRSTTAPQVCLMMTGLFRKKWQEIAQPSSAAPVNETVTLASMIEKETAVPEERPLVASVYDNRLHLGMALDCDPTTIYAAMLEQRYRGVIHKSDLSSANEYNTYRHPGLPPGPIANPGLASLKAAMVPASSNYLYFVAKPDGSGGHHFSSSIAEHDRAVAEYRRGLRAATPGQAAGGQRR